MSTDIGIRELKAHLSECVRRAAAGEHIIVTDRGRPVAQLTGLGQSSEDQRVLDDMARIERGVAEGWITPAKRRGPLGPARPIPSNSGLTIAEVLDEDRGD
ncbi:type II toxin-antitoxin system Phd/YefM family antitoxin [Candidatus Poriferisodalis sp.]|uniref:type II toxin-antitoxin system Phd/YefM family antitoxin n=1 Tax=Candidatus Poriferisodalis sp. TaxID=3101277 RepID=UPI003B524E6A